MRYTIPTSNKISHSFHPSLLLAQDDTCFFPPPTAYYRLAFNGLYCNLSTPTVLLLCQLFPHFVLQCLISPSNCSTLHSPLANFFSLFQAISNSDTALKSACMYFQVSGNHRFLYRLFISQLQSLMKLWKNTGPAIKCIVVSLKVPSLATYQ